MTPPTWHRAVLSAATLCAILLGMGSVAEAQTHVHGTVRFDGNFATLDRGLPRDHVWAIPMTKAAGTPSAPIDELRVALIASSAPPRDVTLDLIGYGASPQSRVVPIGSAITFRNRDEVDRSLVCVGRSDVGTIDVEAGATAAPFKLEKPGRYIFEDRSYSSVRAYVIVAPGVVDVPLSRVDPIRASFDLGEVAPGSYTLRVYRHTAIIHERELVVGDDELDVSFLLSVADFEQRG